MMNFVNFGFSKTFSSPGKKASKSRYRDASRRLRNAAVDNPSVSWRHKLAGAPLADLFTLRDCSTYLSKNIEMYRAFHLLRAYLLFLNFIFGKILGKFRKTYGGSKTPVFLGTVLDFKRPERPKDWESRTAKKFRPTLILYP